MADTEQILTRSASRKRKGSDAPTEREDGGASEELEKSNKRSKSETKKRRSSFVRGRNLRRSLPAANVSCAELHTKVPKDAPAEKRLYLLKQACFEYTMQRLKEESPGLEGFEEFQKAAQESFQSSLDKLDAEGILKRTCGRKNSSLPNPVNVEIEKTAKEIQEQMNRLKGESGTWEELLKYHTEQVPEEQSNQSESSQQPITRIPPSLSQQQRKLITDLPDLRQVQSWAKDSIIKLQLQVDKIHQTSGQLKDLERHADGYLKEQLAHLAAASLGGSVEDPKQMLRQLKL